MDELDGFRIEGGRAFYHPTGSVSFNEGVAMVRSAIAATRSSGVRELLVDVRSLTGFDPPTISKRFDAVEEWSREARGVVRLAMVAPFEMIDPQKFGVTVGANRGLISNIFPTEAEACAWLDARSG